MSSVAGRRRWGGIAGLAMLGVASAASAQPVPAALRFAFLWESVVARQMPLRATTAGVPEAADWAHGYENE